MDRTKYFQQQEKVNAYFQNRASFWKDVYSEGGVFAETIRDRHAATLHWVESLSLASGSRVLEVGCGAGLLTIALAQRGLRVYAIDAVESMVVQARQHAEEAGVADALFVEVGDAYSLAFEDGCFDLVIALGVLPWLEEPEQAIREMARVARPGGYVILSTANRTGLPSILDPWLNPAIVPLKRAVKRILVRVGLRRPSREVLPSKTYHFCRYIDRAIACSGLEKTRGMTRGFVFSLFRHTFLPEPLATALHHRLQGLADRGVPGFRSLGMAYYAMAQRPIPISNNECSLVGTF